MIENKSSKKNNVLLIFPSVFARSTTHTLINMIKQRLESKDITVKKVVLEESCIVLDVSDVVEAASNTVKMFGVDKVAIAKRISNGFKDIVTTIVKTGKQIILPGETFLIKVQISSNTKEKLNYVARDIESASLGDLLSELPLRSSYLSYSSPQYFNSFLSSTSMNARPTKNEDEADKIILSYVVSDSAYVCIQVDPALGGLPFNSQKRRVLCVIHDLLSTVSCLMAIKCGFFPEVLILYNNDEDLKENLKMFGLIVDKMAQKKHKIRIARIDFPSQFDSGENADYYHEHLKVMIQESVCAKILTLIKGRDLVVPFSAAIHPLWFIEAAVKEIVFAQKMPWMPFMLTSGGIYQNAKEVGLEDKIMAISDLMNKITFEKEEYEKYKQRIDSLSKAAVKNIKTISLKVGPHYLHDIIDSI